MSNESTLHNRTCNIPSHRLGRLVSNGHVFEFDEEFSERKNERR